MKNKTQKEKMKAREKIYQILKVNDATNEASWWQIADEVVEAIDKAVTEERERIINTVMEVKYDDLGMGKMSKDEKMGVNAFKMYLKYKLRTKP